MHTERAFEDEICDHLAQSGWLVSHNDAGYDKQRALYPEDLWAWLRDANPDGFDKVFGPPDAPNEHKRTQTLDRLTKQLGQDAYDHGGGTLNTLRKGIDVVGAKRFPLIQQPPQDNLNPATHNLYAKNRLRVVRQVRYSTRHGNSIDLVLFCNGLPVATIELKTDATQSVDDAILQYKNDRDPRDEPLLTAGRGALVHFAVSTDQVFMTTQLAGGSTWFLPFNRGHEHGAGNPPIEGTCPSAYLWGEILQRDTWLEILAKFVYPKHETTTDPVTAEKHTTTQVRFPRYHQWRAVTNLVRTTRSEGSGHSYLVQHSAGSGKTDSIAWLSHRLAALHTEDGKKIFDGVIVIADRQVLDKQLQQAIDQLVTKTGTFQAITRGGDASKSKRLSEALLEGKPIIGVTLQTFPETLAKIQEAGGLDQRRYAVIADEAHSSQTGDATAKLRVALNYTPADGELNDEEDALRVMAERANEDGRLSFFAFTATPKEKTLQLFGRRPTPNAKPEPFDLYPMKQAIEEGFILDVLKNYSTWKMYARLQARSGDEIDLDKASGQKAYKRFTEINPTTITEKTRVIVKHFTEVVRPLLGGRAKAMVVTDSRAAALRYKQAFDAVVDELELPIKALVAFSGEVEDQTSKSTPKAKLTEAQANPDARGKALDEAFRRDEFKLMIVANKYQTGFDQPLLCAMYVDKQLSGITAVQTLSRLNRAATGKDQTYVVDFVNDGEAIRAAFQEYYEDARILTESDEHLVFDLRNKLDTADIYTWTEIDLMYQAWSQTGGARKHTAVLSRVYPARDRWDAAWRDANVNGVDAQAQERCREFKSTAAQYVRAYDFFSQFVNYGDPAYEKLATFLRLLVRMLNDTSTSETPIDVSGVVLTHFRLEKLREESLALSPGKGEGLPGMTEAGMAKQRERERASKSEIIEYVNDLFEGSQLTEADRVSSIETLMRKVMEDEDLQVQAHVNARTDFNHSPTLRTVVEDALWSADVGHQDAMKRLRSNDVEAVIRALLRMGLQDSLKDRAS
ncbi:type I restriction endonuclease [Luteipulveratus sp. YIM 133132]|uniref:type I restriction endonuclease subunit R n=1 Tax=Luteipulveratus flavus TaxID=3031728 RepID=UPI0023AF9725|nr:type I restriction endonuclease [Luteipulveratus sp. YIM 133132]MDE9367242.1 type I restriction endonuclease [Luteipulveratus sp. YIM 133132]